MGELDSKFIELKEKYTKQEKLINGLKESLKDEIISDYDDKYDKLEEDIQKAKLSQKAAKSKTATIDSKISNAFAELTTLRKENEALVLAREKEPTANMQERVELIKTISALEMQLGCLMKEKKVREEKVVPKKIVIHQPNSSPSMSKICKTADNAVQTESLLPAPETKEPALSLKLLQQEERIGKLLEYQSALTREVEHLTAKLSVSNKENEALSHRILEKEIIISQCELKFSTTREEETELRKKLEKAMAEIARLEQKKTKCQRVVRSLSESVIFLTIIYRLN